MIVLFLYKASAMRYILFSVFLFLISAGLQGQDFKVLDMGLAPSAQVRVTDIQDPWMFSIKALGDTFEGNKQLAGELKEVKRRIAETYPRREGKLMVNSGIILSNDTPTVLRSFQGNVYSGVPNDNTMAISNGNKLISAINTTIYVYDVDSLELLKSYSLVSFSQALSYTSSHRYDPKLMYDPQEDKFIIVFLAGASSDTKSHIILGFSESNDPLGNWNLYTLPGNPLPGDTSWTDYPAIALSGDEFFVTGNLLRYGGTWQESFKQSVIWQMDKQAGYRGDSLDMRLYYNIHHEGKPVRNIHPVQGGDHLYGPGMYFLSNRNFALQNDTFFLIDVTGNRNEPATRLNLRPLIADKTYGAPPDARQFGNNLFQTNDARVLGAFYQNNKIQFVGNTIDTTSGFAAIYHGIISYPETANELHGVILSDSVIEYGYPKITYIGVNPWEDQALITFDHTSPSHFAGIASVYYKGDDTYSHLKLVKEGTSYVNVYSEAAERWGDYTGSQRKYNEPGIVWMSGYHGQKINLQRRNTTWIAELRSPEVDIPAPYDKLTARTWPNPVSDNIVNMELFLPVSGTLEVDVIDINGRILDQLHSAEEPAGFQMISFSTASLRAGMYFLRFVHNEEVIETQKLIVP